MLLISGGVGCCSAAVVGASAQLPKTRTSSASKMMPINAAGIAQRNGVEVVTIGVGDPNASGEDRVDFGVLEKIAEITGGQFFEAQDQATLESVYRRIDELAVAEVKTTSWRPRESLVHWAAGAALLLTLMFYAVMLAVDLKRGNEHA